MAPTVLHVAQPTVAGVAVVVRGLVQDQVRRGWRVAVACPTDGRLAEWIGHDGAEHIEWEATRSPGLSTLSETRRLGGVVARVQPDLVHLHSSKAGLAGRLALRGSRPTIFQPHGWSFLAVSGAVSSGAVVWERFATRWTDALAHVSRGERATGEHAGIRARWAHTPNGVDLTRFHPFSRTAARTALHLADRPLVLCVGRLSRQKGQDWLLAAWQRVVRHVPDATLALAGAFERPELDVSPVDGVTVVGELLQPRDWLAAADVVVLPSRWEAGLPLVAREAMASARSVVVSDVPGAREDLPRGAGAVVPVDDVEGLATCLVARLLDAALAEREGQAGLAHARAHFDLVRSAQHVAELYAETCSAFRPDAATTTYPALSWPRQSPSSSSPGTRRAASSDA